jgi:hypothetical protein
MGKSQFLSILLLSFFLTLFSINLRAQENWEMSSGHLGSGANSNQQLADRTPKAVKNQHNRPAEMAAILGNQNVAHQSKTTKKRIAELEKSKKIFFENLKGIALNGDSEKIIDCHLCRGAGRFECSHCKGHGFNECLVCFALGTRTCKACDGVGAISGLSCNVCAGKGYSSCRTCEGKGNIECSYCYGVGFNHCDYCIGSGKQLLSDSAKSNHQIDSIRNLKLSKH